MSTREWFQRVSAVFAGALLAGSAWALLSRMRSLFLPFALGFLIAYLFDPLLDRLEARGWSRLRAVWTVMAALAVVAVVVGALVVPMVIGQAEDAARSWNQYVDQAYALYEHNREQLVALVQKRAPGLSIDVRQTLDGAVENGRAWALQRVPQALQWIGGWLLQSAGVAVQGLIVAIISFHFMMVIDPFRVGLRSLLPAPQAQEVGVVGGQIGAMVGAYIRGQIVVAALVGTCQAVLLTILGFAFGTRYGLILGLVGGAIYLVPWLGALTTMVAAGFLGYFTASHHPLLSALLAIGAVVAVNQAFDNVVMPRIVGRQVGLHPLAILFAIMAGYAVWGLPGMIVAVPMAASIKIAAQRWVPTMPRPTEDGAVPDLDLIGGLHKAYAGARGLAVGLWSRPAPAAEAPVPTDLPTEDAEPESEGRSDDDDPAA